MSVAAYSTDTLDSSVWDALCSPDSVSRHFDSCADVWNLALTCKTAWKRLRDVTGVVRAEWLIRNSNDESSSLTRCSHAATVTNRGKNNKGYEAVFLALLDRVSWRRNYPDLRKLADSRFFEQFVQKEDSDDEDESDSDCDIWVYEWNGVIHERAKSTDEDNVPVLRSDVPGLTACQLACAAGFGKAAKRCRTELSCPDKDPLNFAVRADDFMACVVYASVKGHSDLLQILLELDEDMLVGHPQLSHMIHCTASVYAASRGMLDAVRTIVQSASMRITDNDMGSKHASWEDVVCDALSSAYLNGQLDVVRRISIEYYPDVVQHRLWTWSQHVLEALNYGHVDVVRFAINRWPSMLEKELRCGIGYNSTRAHAVHAAAEMGADDLVSRCIQVLDNSEPNRKDILRMITLKKCLLDAIVNGHSEVTRLLLDDVGLSNELSKEPSDKSSQYFRERYKKALEECEKSRERLRLAKDAPCPVITHVVPKIVWYSMRLCGAMNHRFFETFKFIVAYPDNVFYSSCPGEKNPIPLMVTALA